MTVNFAPIGRILRPAATLGMFVMAGALAAQTVPDSPQTVPDSATPSAGLDLPANLQIFGKADPNVRKATAIVNDTVITGTDVDQRLNLILALQNVSNLPDDQRDQLRLQVLRSLIDETLQVQEAKARDITIPANEIDQTFANIARRFQRTPEQFRAYLRTVGSSEASIRKQIEGELAWQRLLRRRVSPFVNVSEEEVKAIIERLKAQQGTEEFSVKEIFINATPERATEVEGAMRRMVEQMKTGAPFEYFARTYGESSVRAQDGDLGWVRPAMLPAELATALQSMQPGQVVGPIPNSGGFSLIYLADKRQVLTADPRDAKLSLRQVTVRFAPGTTQAQATEIAGRFASAVQTIRGCGSVDAVATSLNAEVVDNDTIRIRDLPPQLQDIMLRLQVGEATPPFGSPTEGVRTLVLCGRDDPQQAGLPSMEQLQNRMEEQRVNLRAQRMLRDLRRDAVVEYR